MRKQDATDTNETHDIFEGIFVQSQGLRHPTIGRNGNRHCVLVSPGRMLTIALERRFALTHPALRDHSPPSNCVPARLLRRAFGEEV